ncbi:MAG TPA: family 16 glycosylhydrolase [Crenalkalicoccus sp.]|nr:family 16 glycosylhydrolase [Crenalkalicoccus sp.]
MATAPTPDASGWVPTFADSFDGGWQEFYSVWPHRYGGQYANGAFAYRPDQVAIANGELTVHNSRTADGWVAGGVDQGFFGQRYGHYEITARVDPGQGTSGAIILWPVSGHWPPEIDMMESPSGNRDGVYFFDHGLPETIGGRYSVDASQWHTYTLDWTPGHIAWGVDGQTLFQTQSWQAADVPDEPMSLGFTGFVAGPQDTWWGQPDASTPAVVDMHVTSVKIEAMPLGSQDQVAPTDAAGAPVQLGPTVIGGQLYAGAVETGDWGAMATATASPVSWDPHFADRMAWTGFAQVNANLAAAGGQDLDVMLLDAKGGSLTTGGGNDAVGWVAFSDAAGAGNTMNIATGDGRDTVRIAPAGWVSQDDAFLHGTVAGQPLNPWYQGDSSSANVSLGTGDDALMTVGPIAVTVDAGPGNDLVTGGLSNDRITGGPGDDTLKGGGGANTFVFAPGDGHDTVGDFVPGTDHLEFHGVSAGALQVQTGSFGGVNGTQITYDAAGDSVLLAGVTGFHMTDAVFV